MIFLFAMLHKVQSDCYSLGELCTGYCLLLMYFNTTMSQPSVWVLFQCLLQLSIDKLPSILPWFLIFYNVVALSQIIIETWNIPPLCFLRKCLVRNHEVRLVNFYASLELIFLKINLFLISYILVLKKTNLNSFKFLFIKEYEEDARCTNITQFMGYLSNQKRIFPNQPFL